MNILLKNINKIIHLNEFNEIIEYKYLLLKALNKKNVVINRFKMIIIDHELHIYM